MGNELKERVALILEAIGDNEIQYGRYDRPIRELIKDLQSRIEELEAESKRLREALRFYASPSSYKYNVIIGEPPVNNDCGKTAKAVLEPRGSDVPTT